MSFSCLNYQCIEIVLYCTVSLCKSVSWCHCVCVCVCRQGGSFIFPLFSELSSLPPSVLPVSLLPSSLHTLPRPVIPTPPSTVLSLSFSLVSPPCTFPLFLPSCLPCSPDSVTAPPPPPSPSPLPLSPPGTCRHAPRQTCPKRGRGGGGDDNGRKKEQGREE